MDEEFAEAQQKKFPFSLVQDLRSFIKQSERVINVTHKPQNEEYKHIATATALGLLVIGIIGFILAMLFHFARKGI